MLNLTTFIGEYPCYLAHITDNNGNDVFSEQIGINVEEICVTGLIKSLKERKSCLTTKLSSRTTLFVGSP